MYSEAGRQSGISLEKGVPPVDRPLSFYDEGLIRMSDPLGFDDETILAIKFELLGQGLAVGDRAWDWILETGKAPQRVRSGASNGLDMVLPGGHWVNAPLHPPHDHTEGPLLEREGDGFVVTSVFRKIAIPVEIAPRPAYYRQFTRSGRRMDRIGQMSGDRIGFGLSNGCYFWKKERRCGFCSIGLNTDEEFALKPLDDIRDTLTAAIRDPLLPARHLLLSGGTLRDEDWGIARFATAARRLRNEFGLPIYVMTVPTGADELRSLKQAGVTEVAINLEVHDRRLAQDIIPGKAAAFSREDYLACLESAREHWRRDQVRSLLVAGMEDMASTLAGVKAILDAGATPILSVFRPLTGAGLERHPRPTSAWLWELYLRAMEIAARHGVELGPACRGCRNNTLS